MIERNIGTTERIVRLVLAVILLGWVISSERLGLLQVLALPVSFALLWNSVFARCYLWKWLGVSSCNPAKQDCTPDDSGNTGGSHA